jgi:hypothetical protein
MPGLALAAWLAREHEARRADPGKPCFFTK